MTTARRPSKLEGRVDYEVNQASHGFSVGTILTHNGSSYVAAQADSASNAEVIGIVSEVQDTNSFTIQTSGHLTGLSGLTAGTVYFLSDTTAGTATSTEPTISKPVYYASSTTEATMLNFRGSDSTLTAGGGDFVLVSTATASNSASIEFTGIDGTVCFVFKGLNPTSTAGTGRTLRMRTSSNNGTSYDSGVSDYNWGSLRYISGNASSAVLSDTADSALTVSQNTDGGTTAAMGGTLYLYSPETTARKKVITANASAIANTGNIEILYTAGFRDSTSIINAVQFFYSADNIAGGEISMYKLLNS